MIIIGIDDAGRGPLIGPMILAGVCLTKEQEEIIERAGATDSKLLSHSRRVAIAEVIRNTAESYEVVTTTPEEIDDTLNSPGTNLNQLEAQKAAEIINSLNKKEKQMKVVVDCPSTNTSAWKNTMMQYVSSPENLDVLCEHKADMNHISAAAASILAKVAREEAVKKIKDEYGDIGSGYPSDPRTKAFLKARGRELADSGIFRKTWATWKKLFPENQQASLSSF